MNEILDAYDKPKKVLKEAAEIEDDPHLPPKAPFTWHEDILENKPHKIIPKVYCILHFIPFIRSCHTLQFENPVFKFNPLSMHKSTLSNQAFGVRLDRFISRPSETWFKLRMPFQIKQIKFWQFFKGHRTIFPFIVYSFFVWVTFMTF